MKHKQSIVLNEPSFYILLALSNEAMSGYDLTRAIYDITKGRLEVKTGTMYPTLKKLLGLELIQLLHDKEQARNKKIYTITKKGKTILQNEIQLLEIKLDEVKSIMGTEQGGQQ